MRHAPRCCEHATNKAFKPPAADVRCCSNTSARDLSQMARETRGVVMCVTVSPVIYRVLYQITLFRNVKH